MTGKWPFADARNVAVLTTANVLDGSHPVLLVTHDQDDGAWQFLCGTTNDGSDGRVVGLEEIVQLDPSLRELADLPVGWRASRESPQDSWHRERLTDWHCR